jgi:hypothetical protein
VQTQTGTTQTAFYRVLFNPFFRFSHVNGRVVFSLYGYTTGHESGECYTSEFPYNPPFLYLVRALGGFA